MFEKSVAAEGDCTPLTADGSESSPATLADVAQAAGVSSMTVSRVINGSASVGQATRSRVWSAAIELAYQPNLAARALASRRRKSAA